MNVSASSRASYAHFVQSCACGDTFRLTTSAEPSLYARCFGVFGRHLLRLPVENPVEMASALRRDIRSMRGQLGPVTTNKPFRQLLTFSLSALAILGDLKTDPLAELVEEQIPKGVGAALRQLGCFDGKPGSGNHAMFLAIFLLHGRDWLGLKTQSAIDQWVEMHLHHMNRFGFWGPDRGMTHLQFQNGYHQYEIFEYLGVDNPRIDEAVAAVRSLADDYGHFAPYPGGGGCYDYDAVFMLTPDGKIPDEETRVLLERTAATLISEQQPDGGFAESLYVRPRSMANLGRFARQLGSSFGNWPLFLERLRYSVALQRPKHDRIHTHWSQYSRRWDESDLWDSWFRMLALARIEVALDPSARVNWGFIDYPGIGFHPSVRVIASNQ